MKILPSKPRRDGQETKGSTRDLRATEPWFNSHLASSCLIWQYGNIFEAQLHHIHPFSSWMGCHFELYFISPLWIPVIWSGVPGNKSTWIIPGLFKPGYIIMYFAVSLRTLFAAWVAKRLKGTYCQQQVCLSLPHSHRSAAKLVVWYTDSWSINTERILAAGMWGFIFIHTNS